jgi:hypothetical protein
LIQVAKRELTRRISSETKELLELERERNPHTVFSLSCLLHHLCKKRKSGERQDWRRLRLREKQREEARYLFLSFSLNIFYFEKCMSDSCMDASSIIGWLLPKKGKKKLLPHYLKTLEDRNKNIKKRGEFKRE